MTGAPPTSHSSKSTDKLKSLMGEPIDTSSNVQDKMKIAFAEGYLANDQKKEPVSSNLFARRLGRIFFYALTFYIGLQLLQMYTSMGGSECCHYWILILTLTAL